MIKSIFGNWKHLMFSPDLIKKHFASKEFWFLLNYGWHEMYWEYSLKKVR